MTDSTAGLVERLRAIQDVARLHVTGSGQLIWQVRDLLFKDKRPTVEELRHILGKAADEIERLEAEIERLTSARAIGQAAGYFRQFMGGNPGVSGEAIQKWLAEFGADALADVGGE